MKAQTLFIMILFFLLSNCTQTTANPPTATAQPENRGVIVAVGNSLTEGMGVAQAEAYPALLERKLRANGYPYRVLNAGISGETSSGALSRVNWILNLNPDIVILETGGNDGLRAIDPELTEANLNAIIDLFQADDVEVVLAGLQTIQNLGQEYTDAYQKVYPAVATEQEVILIPFFLEGVATVPGLNQEDGIHPNADGYQVIVETVYPYVVEAINKRESDQ